jgi:opacity protein-like surface antigen
MSKICKFLKYALCLSVLSIFSDGNATALDDSGNYFGIEYRYPVKTGDNDFYLTVPPAPAQTVYSKNNGGGGGYGSLTYIAENNFFLNAIGGYSKQKYKTSYAGLVPGYLDHRIVEGGVNLGYVLDLDSNIHPYGSFGVGLSHVKTEMMFNFGGGNYVTNTGNNPDELQPNFTYEGGFNFVTSS